MPPFLKCPACGFASDSAVPSDPDFIIIDGVGNQHPFDKLQMKAEADHVINDSLQPGDVVTPPATVAADTTAADTTAVT